MPKEDVDAKAFETALDKAVKEALAEISVEEIEKTKGKMLAGQVYLRDNPNDAAYIAGSMAAVGMSVEDIEIMPTISARFRPPTFAKRRKICLAAQLT